MARDVDGAAAPAAGRAAAAEALSWLPGEQRADERLSRAREVRGVARLAAQAEAEG